MEDHVPPFSSFNFLLKCELKVWAHAHNYYAMQMKKEIPLIAFAVKPEPERSGLEGEANLNFQN